MKKIPRQNKWFVTNGIDNLEGNIEYSKNFHFDNNGVATLSEPMVRIYSQSDNANFGLPMNVFSYAANKYKILTDNNNVFNYNTSSLSGAIGSEGITWQPKGGSIVWKNNNFFMAGDDVYEYDASGDNATYTSRINRTMDNIELFQSRDTIVGSVTNVVYQYDNAYATSNNLTLSENLEITGIKFSNSRVGIITRQRKNDGDALFIVWDGVSEGSNQQVPVSDSFILSVAPYSSSWVIFTSNGQLLFFNGGGFQTIAELPGYRFEDELNSLTPSTSFEIGQNITTDGDIMYVNIPTQPEFTRNNIPYRIGYSSGVWCYDPKMADTEYKLGIYHRHAISYSEYVEESGTVSSNLVTFSTAHMLETGDRVWVDTAYDTISAETIVYAIKSSSTAIYLAETYDDALNNQPITITNGNIDLNFVRRRDYGIDLIRSVDIGLCKRFRQQATYNSTGILPFFVGAKIRPVDPTSSRQAVINALAPRMENIGVITTTKFESSNKKDVFTGVVVKYERLNDGDKIYVKAKTSTFEPIYVGTKDLYEDTYSGPVVTWDRSNRFVTTVDLTNAKKGMEVYIFDGAGCGQSAHIDSIEDNGAGAYTVTLKEDIRGISALSKSCVVIDDYVHLGTVTKSDIDGVKYFGLGKKSKNMKVRLVAKGVNIKIDEIQAIDNEFELSL